jgi:hypothetical protein
MKMTKHPFLNFSLDELIEFGKKNKAKYTENDPFPNIYFDNFFNQEYLKQIVDELPDLGGDKKDIHYENPNESKYASKGEGRFGPKTREFMHFLNSQPFLEFLQELSGVEETLVPDPYFEGGGMHQIKQGGFLKLHVDFHSHKMTHLSRRLNVLIYLNIDWDEAWGGHFELWEKDMSKSVVKIAPHFNRLAMFSTTGDSWHGHPEPLNCPPERSRRSLALYYYTNGRPKEEISDDQAGRITTTFAARKGQDSNKMTIFNTVVNLANDWLPPAIVRLIKKTRNT